ncbi:diguanylate cyclase/phosphodiesterase with PAS/PAC sensor(s) [Magnetococcus marinus MC-1]|uniref:Diguanylate cyclase/phosphodiesterase with PAS/PAC sensor(S) n=1 Tax=Magnetococcus marinus (strain ATCC BAA-1437 / JCM 17883 / MC-1) TaxID=156889 RepID=A0L8L0_MAGMM|nr:bifunctional diguanylate cyclase/phosphodiesterase [Magnetococcus marinus]ABK44303.1 diguanylate cyclase/phosphodiesterase with PAS/PAC sensor(s) [Magnetococcus marinus MC-1]
MKTPSKQMLLPAHFPNQWIPVAIVGVDKHGTLCFYNSRAHTLLQLPEECSGLDLKIEDFFHDLDSSRPDFGMADEFISRQPTAPLVRFTLVHPYDAPNKPVSVEAYFLLMTHGDDAGQLWIAFHSMEETRRLQERLENTEALLAQSKDQLTYYARLVTTLYDNTQEGVLLLDDQGTVQAVNNAYTIISGYHWEELLGKSVCLCHGGLCEESNAELQTILSHTRCDGSWEVQWQNSRRNGEFYLEQIRVTMIEDLNGTPQSYVVVVRDLSYQDSSIKGARTASHEDALTGLPNRSLFADRLEQVLTHAKRSGEKVAVILLGLDGFRKINDSLGHQIGDQILTIMAQRFQTNLRGGDTVARMGSDEFGFIARDLISTQSILSVLGKIKRTLSAPIKIADSELVFTAGIGISVTPDDSLETDTLIRYADAALGRAKAGGGNIFTFFTQTMEQNASKRLHLEGRLRKAIEQEELTLFYQAKISCEDSPKISGFEALVRWITPEGDIISPGDFIPIAEETGLIIPLGSWVIDRTCRDIAHLQALGFPPVVVSANLSPRQFVQDGLLQVVQQALVQHGIDPCWLELEITESSVMGSVDQATELLKSLVALGVHIALDDFGTGYSSLAYLKRFPFHTLKVDRAFVQTVEKDRADQAILQAIVSLARNLELQVVAEGVENEGQRDFITQAGCHSIQGFYYSKPLPLSEVMEKWATLSQGPMR